MILPPLRLRVHSIRHDRRFVQALACAMALLITLFFGEPALANSDPIPEASLELVAMPSQPEAVAWPTQTWPESEPTDDVDQVALESAIANLFEPVGRGGQPDSRALVIVQNGHIVVERYADGFDTTSRFHTWSMAKSFTQALIGILIRQDRLELDRRVPVPEWQSPGDPRGEITLRQMLNMTSGISNEDFPPGVGGPSEFVRQLLFGRGAKDLNTFAADAPLGHPPGTRWAYSTATSSLLAGVVGRAVGDDAQSRSAFIHRELLDPIGASDIVFEFDRAGHFLGGSHLYGRARDFARFGLLYLRDGLWEGRRILPEGWVDFSRTRAPANNNGNYGGHFWLNLPPKKTQFNLFPGRPTSVFEASGNNGQFVIIVPTHDLVIVRLGEMQSTNWDDLNANLAKILDVFPARASVTRSDPEAGGSRDSETSAASAKLIGSVAPFEGGMQP